MATDKQLDVVRNHIQNMSPEELIESAAYMASMLEKQTVERHIDAQDQKRLSAEAKTMSPQELDHHARQTLNVGEV